MRISILAAIAMLLVCEFSINAAPKARFIRGDADRSGVIDIEDSIRVLEYVDGVSRLHCLDSADFDDNGRVNGVDGLAIINFVFMAGTPPAAPWPSCGYDSTFDFLSCNSPPGYCRQ